MNTTEISFVAAAAAAFSGKALPAIGQSPARFADHVFETSADAPDRPGVFVLTTELSGRALPVYIGESDSVVVAVSAILAANPIIKRLTVGVFWQVSPFSLDRKRLVGSLVEEYQPHFNVLPELQERTGDDHAPTRIFDGRAFDPIELIARF